MLLNRSAKELRDHLVLESAQLANVESKFPVMRELLQQWCPSRRILSPQKPPMEIATVSTTVGDSGLRLVGTDRGKNRDMAQVREMKRQGQRKEKKEKGGENGKGKNNGVKGDGARNVINTAKKTTDGTRCNGMIPVSLLCLTLDPLYRNAFKR